MNKRSIFTALVTAALLTSAALPGLALAAPVDVNINLNGYLPAPPGVHVFVDAGRPYYVERGHRVYMEKDRRHHRKHGHEYREHEDRGRHLGHMKGHRHDG
jgi:hypothetical protein